LLAAAVATASSPALALEQCVTAALDVTSVTISGNSATAEGTLLELLPRPLPDRFSERELEEFERRLNNLGIFDHVVVRCESRGLGVRVREKWTLVPELDYSSGQTLADTYALVGVTEYNLFGTANSLGLSAYRQRRGFGMSVAFAEHGYQRRGWALEAAASVGTESLRFDDGGWRTTSADVTLSMRSPPVWHEYINIIPGIYASAETVSEVRGEAPSATQSVQTFIGLSWDAYEWHDLVPFGLQASVWLFSGGVFGADALGPRDSVEASFSGALPLGRGAVLVGRAEGIVGTRGNVNYGWTVGSVGGVRGLRDATYFNWVQLVGNLEVRQSLRLGQRWALQGVAFYDAAVFEQMTVEGGRGTARGAFSFGVGARVIPTWISNIVLRLDTARLLAPELSWFTQLGLNQYF